jgi:DCN1-like protein 1/2
VLLAAEHHFPISFVLLPTFPISRTQNLASTIMTHRIGLLTQLSYFNVTTQTVSSSSRTALNKIFDKFKDSPDTIGMTGTQRYFSTVDISLEDITSLIAFEIVQAPQLGEIPREGFISGWSALGCDTLDKQKSLIRNRRAKLSTPESRDTLKKIYKHSFKLFLSQSGQKSIDKDTAVAVWQIFFAAPALAWRTPSGRDWLAMWTEFLGQSSTKGVNMDVWDQTFKFVEEVLRDETLAWWDEMASWPGIIDEFVEWLGREKGIGKKGNEDVDEMEY